MKVPEKLKDDVRLKNRFKYLINKLGINPMDLGFEFQSFWNGRSMTFEKKSNFNTIIISMNYWNGIYSVTLYRNTFSDMRFKFNNVNKYPITLNNISRILKIVERTKTRGVTGYWYTCADGYLKFKFDKTHHKTMMVCKSIN